jgi:bifunctional oligoribonuclease and PAP phosphatase NrnA
MSQIKDLDNLIQNAQKILITSHISPDPDAITSILLLGITLQANFHDKRVTMSSEEALEDLKWLAGHEKIIIQPLHQALTTSKTELIILVDAMNFGRCTKEDEADINKMVHEQKIPVAIIDHHEPAGKYEAEVYINRGSPATIQDVYEVCFNQLKLSKPQNYAETTMTGLYSDTGGFVYLTGNYRETLRLAGDLIEAGAKIENIKTQLNQYNDNQLKVIAELANNLSYGAGYTYSFIKDEFIDKWRAENKLMSDVHVGGGLFTNAYIRNISGRKWGFIIYRNPSVGNHIYAVSFRSIAGSLDVAAIANKLGGGGHKPAAGAKFEAANLQEALQKVLSAIKS